MQNPNPQPMFAYQQFQRKMLIFKLFSLPAILYISGKCFNPGRMYDTDLLADFLYSEKCLPKSKQSITKIERSR